MGDHEWITASASDQSGTCVEQRRTGDLIEVRDTKDREGPVLRFRPDEFAAWLDGAKKGEFDHLLGRGSSRPRRVRVRLAWAPASARSTLAMRGARRPCEE